MPLSLNLKPAQTLNPVMLQAMSLIRMPLSDFEKYIEDIVYENPVFEFDDRDYFGSSKRDSYSIDSTSDIIEDSVEGFDETETLYFDIKTQLFSRPETEKEKKNALRLAEYLDERAYIDDSDFEDFCSVYGKDCGEKALRLLQSLLPSGIAARNLGECICIQLRLLDEDTAIAQEIAQKYLTELAKNKYNKLSSLLNVDLDTIMSACDQIRQTNPRPASGYKTTFKAQYVIPDFFIDEEGILSVNPRSKPQLSINYSYQNSLSSTDSGNEAYLKACISSAERLINCIDVRYNTLYLCAAEIVRYQKDFFDSSKETNIKPLTREALANNIGLSESTVCRALKGKYIQLNDKNYPMEMFFTSGFAYTDNSYLSSYAIKDIIRKIITEEDKTKALSDEAIVRVLLSRGIVISRRAVSNYRQQMNIPSSYERRA